MPTLNLRNIDQVTDLIESFVGPLVGARLAAIEIAATLPPCSHPIGVHGICQVCDERVI